jgi:hypothetical protein
MSENISSNVLFHFTKSMEDLKSILKNGFFPHYCLEYSLRPEDKEAASSERPPMRAAPMVCFCDLPLSLIRKHLKEYGNFGIGVDKKWGIRNGVAPVIYTHSKAMTRSPVSRLTSGASKSGDDTPRTRRDITYLGAYTKPFEGPAWRDNQIQKKVRFYDEREWRYVPVIRRADSLFLNRKDYEDNSKRNAFHKRLKKEHTLQIRPDVIRYLIVPYDEDEKNVIELHDYLMKLYRQRYGRKDAIVVVTAIMTDDCIQEDV